MMGADTKIQWTDYSWSPWHGCTKVATGCENCYAASTAKRNPGTLGIWGPSGTRVVNADWEKPLRWNRQAEKAGVRRRVFPSICDPFEDFPGQMSNHKGQKLFQNDQGQYYTCNGLTASAWTPGVGINRIREDFFKLIDATPWLDWLLLTKRPENARKMWPFKFDQSEAKRPAQKDIDAHPYYRSNAWLGTSIACQDDANRNAPLLLKCRDLSPVLFLSAEPLVGPVNFHNVISERRDESEVRPGELNDWLELYMNPLTGFRATSMVSGVNGPKVDWVIAGGESGSKSRPCNVDWMRRIVKQCREAGVPCFVKQLGSVILEDTPGDDWPDLRPACPTRRRGWGDDRHIRIVLDKKGGKPAEWPDDLRVREFPPVEAARV